MLKRYGRLVSSLSLLITLLLLPKLSSAQIVSVTNDTICAPGEARLKVTTVSPNDTVWWWFNRNTTVLQGITVGNAEFTTPFLRNSLTYWVSTNSGTTGRNTSVSAVVKTSPAPVGALNSMPINSLVGKYGFDSDLTDKVGSNDARASVSGVNFSADRYGRSGRAINFAGFRAGLVTDSVITTMPAQYTLSLWFKTSSTTGGMILGYGTGNTLNQFSATRERQIFIDNQGRMWYGYWANGNRTITTGRTYNDGVWHHVAVSSGTSGTILYIDGENIGSNTNNGAAQTGSTYLRMGYDTTNQYVGSGTGFSNVQTSSFEGDIDDLEIYNAAATSSQVLALFKKNLVVSVNGLFRCGADAGTSSTISIANSEINKLYTFLKDGVPFGTTILGNDSTIDFNTGGLTQSTDFTIKVSDINTACELTLDTVINIRNGVLPSVPTLGNITVCGAQRVSLKPTGAGTGKFNWYTSATALTPTFNADSISFNAYPGDSIVWWVSALDTSGCESARTSAIVKSNILPRSNNFVGNDSLRTRYNFSNNHQDASGFANNMNQTGTNHTTDRFGNTNSALNTNTASRGNATARSFNNVNSFSHSIFIRTNSSAGGLIAGLSNQPDRTQTSTVIDRLIYLANNGRVGFKVGATTIFSDKTINDGLWHHIAASLGANGMMLYIDGVLHSSDANVTAGLNFNGNLRFFYDNLSSVPNAPATTGLTSIVDDYRFYTRTLSAREIRGLAGSLFTSVSATPLVGCGQVNTTVSITNSQLGVNYQLISLPTLSNVGTALAGNGTTLAIPATVTATGSLGIVATDAVTGCNITFDTTISITVNPVPNAPTKLSADTVVCGTISYTVRFSGANEGQYRWYTTATGGSPFASASSFQHVLVPGQSALGWVSVINTFGCESPRVAYSVRANDELSTIVSSYDLVKPVKDGLVTLYKFNGNLNDASGATPANNGNLTVARNYVADRFGATTAIRLNGSGIITTTRLFNNPTNFTVSAWIKTNTTTGGRIIGFNAGQSGTGGNYDRLVYMTNAGTIIFGVNPSGIQAITSTRAINDDNWHLVTATLGSEGMKLYIDGQLNVNRTTVTSAQVFNGYWAFGGGTLGGSFPTQPTNDNIVATIDEGKIFDRQLSDAEVRSMFAETPLQIATPVAQSCDGAISLPIVIYGAQAGRSYQLTKNGSAIGTAVIANTDSVVVNTPILTVTDTFGIEVKDTTGFCQALIDTQLVLAAGVRPPQPLSTDQTICGGGVAALFAQGATNGNYRWYASETSNIVLGVDSIFRTQPIAVGDSSIFFVATANASGCVSLRTKVMVKAITAPRNTFRQERRNLRYYFNFDNGALTDRSGFNYNGSINPAGSVKDTADRFGMANGAKYFGFGTFNTSKIATATNITTVATVFSSYSVSIWFKTTDVNGGRLIGFGDQQNNNSNAAQIDRTIYLTATGNIAYVHRGTGATINQLQTPGRYNDDKWHNAVATFSPANGMRLYVDGVLQGANPGVNTSLTGNGRFRLGYDILNNFPNVTSTAFYTGALDDARVYGRELNTTEIVTLSGEPFTTLSASKQVFCEAGDSVIVTLRRVDAGKLYQLTLDGVPSGASQVGVDSLRFNSGPLTATTKIAIEVTDPNTGCVLELDTAVNVVNLPLPTITGVNDTTRCGTGQVTMRARGAVTGQTYRWYDVPTGGASLGSTATLTPTVTVGAGSQLDSVIRYVTVVNSAGCEGPRVRVRARAVPAATAPQITAPNGSGGCAGDSVLLQGPAGAVSYVWRQGATTLAVTGRQIWVKNPGSFTLLVNNGFCLSPASTATSVSFGTKAAKPTLNYIPGSPTNRLTASTTSVGTFVYRWFLNGVQQVAQTTSVVTNPANGNWTVVILNNGCASDTSDALLVNGIKTAGSMTGVNFNLYPNPNNGEFTMSLEKVQGDELYMQIIDAQGREMYSENLSAQLSNGSVNGNFNLRLPAGTYLLQLRSDNGYLNKSFTVK